MAVLVIGSKGQLGWELDRKARKFGLEVIPRDLPDFSLTDRDAVDHEVGESGVSFVVNAAAYTAVDKAESDPESAFAVNETGPAYLTAACRKKGIPMIHVSTDYVFDGRKKEAYTEADPVCPMGVYGKSKAAGEKVVRASLDQHIIIRTAWLCGVHGNNFVKTMLRLGKEKESIGVVADQYGSPTFASDLAAAVLEIVNQFQNGRDIPWGTYHYAGAGRASWYEFAKRIFDDAGQYTELKVNQVTPLTTEQYPVPAPRPANSTLDCSRIHRAFGIQSVPWRIGLQNMLRKLFAYELAYSADE